MASYPPALGGSRNTETTVKAAGPVRAGRRDLRHAISIRATLFLMGCAVVVPLLAISLYTVERTARNAEALEREILLDSASARAQAVEVFQRRSRATLQALAERPRVRALDPAACDPVLADALSIHPELSNLALRRLTGEPVCIQTQRALLSTEEITRRDWFKEAIAAEGFHVGNAILGQVTGRWVSVASHIVRDRAGVPAGVIVAPIVLERFDELLDASQLPQGSVAVLADRNGTVLSRSQDIAAWRGKHARSAAAVQQSSQHEHGNARAVGLDGVERIYGYATVPSSGWKVTVGVPVTYVTAAVYRQAGEAAMVCLALLLFAAALVYAVSRAIVRPISDLRSLVRAAAEGYFRFPVEVRGPAEVRELAGEFGRMLAARERAEAALKQALAAHVRQQDQLLALGRRLATLQEKERRDIARELHDRVGQSLTALGLNLESLRAAQPGEEALRRIEDSRALLEQTGRTITDVLTELKPPMLASYGLLDALRFHAREFSRRTGIEVRVDGVEERFAPEIEMTLFRIGQAALNNVAQHAQAKSVRVTVERAGVRVRFAIRDDGAGFDTDKALASGRWGFAAMRERAEAIDGTLRIDSAPGRGTGVVVEFQAGA